MPIMLPSVSRREFLKRSLFASAGVLVCHVSFGADANADANRFALMADTHIAGDEKMIKRGAHLAPDEGRRLARLVLVEVLAHAHDGFEPVG